MTRRRMRNLVLSIGGILLLIGVGFVRDSAEDQGGMTLIGGDTSTEDSDGASEVDGEFTDEGAADMGPTPEEGVSQGSSGLSGTGASGRMAQGGSTVMGGGSGADSGGDSSESIGTLPLPPLQASDRIIKDGRLEVEVPEGSFDRAFNAVVALAAKVGGQVVGSQSSSDGERANGEITIRVAAQRFEELLASTAGIGTVQHRQITSQDVSGEFVDLQARVRHLQAQERFYLELLGKARVVGDAIAINQHLSSVQAEMEQAQGRLRLLDERTTYSRLTVALYEPGVTPLLSDRLVDEDGVLSQAWAEALRALQETMGALLVGVFTVAPLAALGVAGWALWRRLRPRPAAPRDPRPVAEEEQGPLPVG